MLEKLSARSQGQRSTMEDSMMQSQDNAVHMLALEAALSELLYVTTRSVRRCQPNGGMASRAMKS